MPKITQIMRSFEVDRIKEVGRHPIGQSLYLGVTPTARRYLVRFTDADGRRAWKTLGNANVMTLAEARALAARAPDEAKSKLMSQSQLRAFATVADEVITMNWSAWKHQAHRRQWRQTIDDYAVPVLGALNIGDIRTEDVAAVLRPLWLEKHETARRLRARIEAIIHHEFARTGELKLNPADIKLQRRLLPHVRRTEPRHHEAPTLIELRALWPRLQQAPAHLALKWIILTVCRTGEAEKALWSEIDEPGACWTIPLLHGKTRSHRVPLIEPALTVLREAADRSKSEYLFPNDHGQPLAQDSLRQRLARMLGRRVTVHGIRATFRTWAEETGKDRVISEMALAHVVESGTVRAYQRADLFEARRRLMQEWWAALQ